MNILALDASTKSTGWSIKSEEVRDSGCIASASTSIEKRIAYMRDEILKLIKKYNIDIIVIGNGTASRESEAFIAKLIQEHHLNVEFAIISEAGASVYSASKLATEEFPNFDVGQRSAASIARRLQDPLAELVKIEPKAIGVGQYQHDMNQKKLSEALSGVVEDCVNKVGVDLNTASAPLLSYISGISGAIAKNIVAYREENGRFTDRKQLLKVAKLGPKAFEQCAGFMRIQNGTNPLDGTSVHPESYEAAEKLLKKQGLSLEDISGGKLTGLSLTIKDYARLAGELEIGEITLRDIVKELEKPGRDPRDEMPRPILRTDVLDMKDLKVGMILKGTVRNVIDFGAFVDIGGVDGLCHISELSWNRIKHPSEVVSVGDTIEVYVKDIDTENHKVSLGYKKAEDNPWEQLKNNYPIGSTFHAPVVSLTKFGAFVRILPGVDGLVHISEISNDRVEKVSDALKVGDMVDVKLLDVDFDKKRISLSMKALLNDDAE